MKTFNIQQMQYKQYKQFQIIDQAPIANMNINANDIAEKIDIDFSYEVYMTS